MVNIHLTNELHKIRKCFWGNFLEGWIENRQWRVDGSKDKLVQEKKKGIYPMIMCYGTVVSVL